MKLNAICVIPSVVSPSVALLVSASFDGACVWPDEAITALLGGGGG
jgi:hypothetical protein